MSRRLIAYVHIEKTAGTTVSHLLRATEPLRYAYVRPVAGGPVFTAADLRVYMRLNPFIRIVAGHSVKSHSDLNTIRPDVCYVTVLREPIARYVSHLLQRLDAGDLDGPEAFLDDERFTDLQTRSIISTLLDRRRLTNDDLHAAIDALEADFSVVGLSGELDRFARDMCHIGVATPNPGSLRANQASKRTPLIPTAERVESVLAEYGGDIADRNQLDIQLYRAVVERMKSGDADAASARPVRRTDRARLAAALAIQRAWFNPVTGLLRRRSGRPSQGWY